LYDECVAMLTYPDGGRRLIGADGLQIPVEPTLHPIDDAARRELEAHIDRSVVVPLRVRDEQEIPAVTWGSRRRRALRWWRSIRRGALVRYRTRTFRPRIAWASVVTVILVGVAAFLAFRPGGVPPATVMIAISVAVVRIARSSRRR
jgi:hypothetical protein